MTDLKQYFNTHPCLNLSAVEKAAGMPAKSLRRFLSGERKLIEEHEKKLMVVIVNYGFGPKMGQGKKSGPKLGQAAPPKAKARPNIGPKKKSEASEKAGYIFNLCNAAWFSWFEEKKDMKPAFDGAEGKALKMIIKKLVEKAKEKNVEDTPASIQHAFKWLLTRVEDNDWIFQNADLKLINSKFNPLIAKQNGNKTNLPSDSDLIAEAQRIANKAK